MEAKTGIGRRGRLHFQQLRDADRHQTAVLKWMGSPYEKAAATVHVNRCPKLWDPGVDSLYAAIERPR